ncbi:MAG: hypothetical protein RIF41_32845 [Polyangiaceae bacterium]
MSEDAGHRYQPFYCEENVWWLLQHPDCAGHERFALFISNAARQCPVWAQKAAPEDGLAVWDYHVIAIVRRQRVEAWDLDTRLGMPVPLEHYLALTWPRVAPTAPPFAPRFRLVAAEVFLTTFCTDRGHMRGEDGWLHPPPPWPPPRAREGTQGNLMRFVDLDAPFAGEVMDLVGLKRRFGIDGR